MQILCRYYADTMQSYYADTMHRSASQCICFRIVICLAFQESKPPTAEEVDEFIRHNKVDAKVSDLL